MPFYLKKKNPREQPDQSRPLMPKQKIIHFVHPSRWLDCVWQCQTHLVRDAKMSRLYGSM